MHFARTDRTSDRFNDRSSDSHWFCSRLNHVSTNRKALRRQVSRRGDTIANSRGVRASRSSADHRTNADRNFQVYTKPTTTRGRRERGPAICMSALTKSDCAESSLTKPAIRYLYSASWASSSNALLVSDLQSTARVSHNRLHTGWNLLFLQHLMPRRTRACRAVQQTRL